MAQAMAQQRGIRQFEAAGMGAITMGRIEAYGATVGGAALGPSSMLLPEKWTSRSHISAGLTLGGLASPWNLIGGGRGVAAEGSFVGPLIGKSGFRTSSEFAEAVGARYQGFVDDAYVVAQRNEARGLLTGNPNTRLGVEVDRISAARLEAYLQSEGIKEGPGSLVQMNRWLRDPNGSGLYVRPDVRIPAAGRIFDATVGFKPYNAPQIMRFGHYSGGDYVTLVRPGAVGGSYSVIP